MKVNDLVIITIGREEFPGTVVKVSSDNKCIEVKTENGIKSFYLRKNGRYVKTGLKPDRNYYI